MVYILDPAVGTATFLYFVVQKIYETVMGQAGGWNNYVDKYLLPPDGCIKCCSSFQGV